MHAMVTQQGTAASETALCDDCFTTSAAFDAERRADDDVDKQRGFIDCAGNDALVCTSCGRSA